MFQTISFVHFFNLFSFMFSAVFYTILTSYSAVSLNVVTVLEPSKDTQWFLGSNSHKISWKQSGNSFKWDIKLLKSSTKERVVDIRTSMSEFREGVMAFDWLTPESLASGRYIVRVAASGREEEFGESQEFIILNEADNKLETSFSPSSTLANHFEFSSHLNDTEDTPLLPHELRHQRRLQNEAEYFRNINISEYWPKPAEYCTIARVHRPSRERFENDFVRPGIPVVITGLTDEWTAMKDWDFDKLESRLTRGVKVNIMDLATPFAPWNQMRQKLAASLRDPPQVYMTDFHSVYPELMNDFTVPEILEENSDFMKIVDADIRPSQFSFQMAPRRSGYHWRVEALNASLWSALVRGHKRWGLYPPRVYFPPGVVHNNHRLQDSQSSEPFNWWAHTQPHLCADRRPLECVQGPGEILYIPSGWWWSHINLEDSITLQHWFCDKQSLRACLEELKQQSDSGVSNYNADIFIQLRHHLERHYPEFLAEDDRRFESPVEGKGRTFEQLKKDVIEDKWQEYFGKHEIGVDFDA